jgi:hypothetical protein
MTENIHQQRIGAVGAIKLPPLPICSYTRPLESRMNFIQPPIPSLIAANPIV